MAAAIGSILTDYNIPERYLQQMSHAYQSDTGSIGFLREIQNNVLLTSKIDLVAGSWCRLTQDAVILDSTEAAGSAKTC